MSTSTATPQKSSVSPSSSPRLPSPPPFTEVQIGPKSPGLGPSLEQQSAEPPYEDDGATRRIRPGTKAADMAAGPPLVPLAELESPFQLQEHLKALYHVHTRGGSDETITPLTKETAIALSTPPAGIERPLWLYELCRFLTMKANNLIIAFFADSPPCSASTCPEMRASEWQYLCAVHDPPKSCCAIDYCCHTLDWAANILTSPKYFPSRLTIGGELGSAGGPSSGGLGGSQASMRHLTNIFRRVYRIFAHAWFQHRGIFWQVEGNEGLYIFFKTVCDMYQLVPEDNYTIPNEAETADGETLETPVGKTSPEASKMSLLKKESGGEMGNVQTAIHDDEDLTANAVPATARRPKHSHSTGSQVTTITEGSEDEEQSLSNSSQQSILSLSPPAPPPPPPPQHIETPQRRIMPSDQVTQATESSTDQDQPQRDALVLSSDESRTMHQDSRRQQPPDVSSNEDISSEQVILSTKREPEASSNLEVTKPDAGSEGFPVNGREEEEDESSSKIPEQDTGSKDLEPNRLADKG